MGRKKSKKHSGPLVARSLTDKEQLDLLEGDLGDHVRVYEALLPGEFHDRSFRLEPRAQGRIQGYVQALQEGGLDLGKGNASFGYKMQLPETDTGFVYVRIFRRH